MLLIYDMENGLKGNSKDYKYNKFKYVVKINGFKKFGV